MKRVNFLMIAALILVFFSCSENDDDMGSTQLVALDAGYIPFYPGNYWVYEQYRIDTLGNETILDTYDSVFISRIEVVNGIQYFVFEGTWMSSPDSIDNLFALRDSAGYFVDPSGTIYFTDQNFTDTLETFTFVISNGDTLYESWYKMESEPQTISVPAGEFEALNYHGTIHTIYPNPQVPAIRYKDKLYSKNVGLVLDNYFYLGSPNRFERRLKHYYIDQQSFLY